MTDADAATYPGHPRATLGRYRPRGRYDYEMIHSIINAAPILHVSFIPSQTDPFPTILPLLGQVGLFENPTAGLADEPLDLYIHSHISTRLNKLAQAEFEATQQGLPVCVSAALVDGYVLALTPFNHSCNYRSVVLHGYATLVTDDKERAYAMELITNGLIPKRWENTRVPPTKVELDTTGILKVTIESASAKVRAAGVGDVKYDLNDEAVAGKVWTGVVPTWQAFGGGIPSAANKASMPAYLEDWRKEMNVKGEAYSVDAAGNKK